MNKKDGHNYLRIPFFSKNTLKVFLIICGLFILPAQPAKAWPLEMMLVWSSPDEYFESNSIAWEDYDLDGDDSVRI